MKVIIVTHGKPRRSGGETGPQGDIGEKVGQAGAPTGCALAAEDSHTCAEVESHTHTDKQ